MQGSWWSSLYYIIMELQPAKNLHSWLWTRLFPFYCFIMDNSSASHVLFLLWFFAATFSFCKGNSNVSCNEKEKQALLIFKRGLTNSGNTLSSWSDQEDCCRWEGVLCDNKTGRVRELHVGDLYLQGEISHFLLELEYLHYLDLSFINFNCTRIPSFLGSMASLKHLAISGFCVQDWFLISLEIFQAFTIWILDLTLAFMWIVFIGCLVSLPWNTFTCPLLTFTQHLIGFK